MSGYRNPHIGPVLIISVIHSNTFYIVMKVTHIFWSLGFGGIETMLVNIANAQAEAGSEVSVLIINELYEQSLVNSLDKRVNLVFLNRKKGR